MPLPRVVIIVLASGPLAACGGATAESSPAATDGDTGMATTGVGRESGGGSDVSQDAGPGGGVDSMSSDSASDGNTLSDSSASSGGQATDCFPPDTDLVVTHEPTTPLPPYLAAVPDLTFGTEITRITDQAIFTAEDIPRPWHHYAKNQPWNSDGTRIILDGWPSALLDGSNYALIKSVRPPNEHHTWANTDPQIVYGVQTPVDFVAYNVDTDESTVLRSFGQFDEISYGSYEGNMSADDRYVALMGRSDGEVSIFVYDLQSDSVSPMLDGQGVWPNNVAMSQSGDYVLVQWGVTGSGEFEGISVHDGTTLAFLRHVSNLGGAHADYCYDTNGDEVMVVTSSYSSALEMVRLSDGSTTELLSKDQIDFDIHVSCRNLARPGWAYVSHFHRECCRETKPNANTLFAVRLDGSGTVEIFGHQHQSDIEDYDRAAFGVPSRDGTRVMFRSDWHDGTGSPEGVVHSYVAQASCD